jgi:predicted enzyme related to lactoylglutathione lyase
VDHGSTQLIPDEEERDVVDVQHGKICYIVMPSRDVERSGTFYRDVFSWTLRTDGEGGASFDDSTGQVSGTWVSDRPAASRGNLEVHIMVDDLVRTIDAIRDAGGSVDETDIHVESERWAVFTDPDGNRLGIYQQAGGS